MTDQPDPIGPFVPASDPTEQLTRRRSLPAPVVIFGGPIIGLCSLATLVRTGGMVLMNGERRRG
jgi:hypothetical protein